MISVLIHFIHNNEVDRIKKIDFFINKLLRIKNLNFFINYDYISKQIIHSAHLSIVLISRYSSLVHEIKLLSYLRKKLGFNIFKKLLNFHFNLIVQLIFHGERLRKFRQIEVAVTNKHIESINKFLATDNQYLIVFESDFVVKKNSLDNFINLLNRLVVNNNEIPLYIDLAGGFKLSEICGNLSYFKDKNDILVFERPITNTGCVYIINVKMAQLIISEFYSSSYIQMLGYDFVLNEVFFKNSNIYCGHCYPVIFDHGSFTGESVSWTKNLSNGVLND